MSARKYTVSFEKVTVSAVQDLIQLNGPTAGVAVLRRAAVFDVDATAPTTNGQLALRISRLSAVVTNGGGSAATPRLQDPGDAAATCTAVVNSTSKATTTGTTVTLLEGGCNVLQSFDDGSLYFPLPAGQALVFELITAPPAGITLSGMLMFEEIG